MGLALAHNFQYLRQEIAPCIENIFKFYAHQVYSKIVKPSILFYFLSIEFKRFMAFELCFESLGSDGFMRVRAEPKLKPFESCKNNIVT